mmetsp:Transcript_61162/g.162511  ORF Transcript_61162/g.162511 Transcript_61162/m.162511 type:complete len:208 (-) Transcript_61162:1187-1810(-)
MGSVTRERVLKLAFHLPRRSASLKSVAREFRRHAGCVLHKKKPRRVAAKRCLRMSCVQTGEQSTLEITDAMGFTQESPQLSGMNTELHSMGQPSTSSSHDTQACWASKEGRSHDTCAGVVDHQVHHKNPVNYKKGFFALDGTDSLRRRRRGSWRAVSWRNDLLGPPWVAVGLAALDANRDDGSGDAAGLVLLAGARWLPEAAGTLGV